MHDKLRALIPEFDLIEDQDLREKTLSAFSAAMTAGGWQPEDLDRMPFTILMDPSPATMLQQIRAVVQTCLAIARALREGHPDDPRMHANNDILLAGAILHDCGKFVEFEEKDGKFGLSRSGELLFHPFSGMALAHEAGLPEEVLHAIAYHSKEGDGRRITLEAIIINHAHFLNVEPFKI